MQGARVIDAREKAGLERGVREAAEILAAGGVVAFPTESFYGLGVDVRSEEAIRRLFLVKERDPERPVLLLAASREQALSCFAGPIPPGARRLMDKFWPGGLTLVYWAAPGVNPLLTAGTDKIGVRVSSHPVPTALTRALGSAVTGTSANLSGRGPCSTALEVEESLGRDIDLILDGGPAPGGTGSTVLDITRDPPAVIRAGLVSPEDVERTLLKG